MTEARSVENGLPKYLWRVTGEWPPLSEIEEGYPPANRVRHYLTKQAADRRAQAWIEGREYEGREPETNAPDVLVIPPALRVTVERSAPITFPTCVTPSGRHCPFCGAPAFDGEFCSNCNYEPTNVTPSESRNHG